MITRCLVALGASLISMSALAAEPTTGPVIEGYGRSALITDSDVQLPANHDYRVVWEITQYGNGPEEVNRAVDRVARFLNLHAKAGVSTDNMHLAIVTHMAALKTFLSDGAYEREYQMRNPNAELVQRLIGAGVQIYVCGQSMTFQGLAKSDLAPGVMLAPSAMTMVHLLQDQGYTLQ
jgi:intracellular sulfur oxidation DsrE/DsrF family protein